jgi:hypothetical protein
MESKRILKRNRKVYPAMQSVRKKIISLGRDDFSTTIDDALISRF